MKEWKKLKRIEGGFERICHYPKNQYGDAPCYGCADWTKCNHDIFERLAQYEDTGLTPALVAEYKKFEDEVVASNLTFAAVLELIEKYGNGNRQLVELACPLCGHSWFEEMKSDEWTSYCPECGKETKIENNVRHPGRKPAYWG